MIGTYKNRLWINPEQLFVLPYYLFREFFCFTNDVRWIWRRFCKFDEEAIKKNKEKNQKIINGDGDSVNFVEYIVN